MYPVFGERMASSFRFSGLSPEPAEGIDVTFRCTLESTGLAEPPNARPSYESPFRSESGRSRLEVYRTRDFDLLRFPTVMDFFILGEEIVCHILEDECAHRVELGLLGHALPFWLSRRGIPLLHASAVCIGGSAVLFVGHSGAGKTTLAGGLARRGALLLSDDSVPVELRDGRFMARPGYRAMRMTPEVGRRYLGDMNGLPWVDPMGEKRWVPVGGSGIGEFRRTAAPIAGIYLLDRDEDATSVQIDPINGRSALLELVRHSFFARAHCLGRQEEWLRIFADLVRQIPVRRLRYPCGLECIEQVCQNIEEEQRSIVGFGDSVHGSS